MIKGDEAGGNETASRNRRAACAYRMKKNKGWRKDKQGDEGGRGGERMQKQLDDGQSCLAGCSFTHQ